VSAADFKSDLLQVTKPKTSKGKDGSSRFNAYLNYNKARYVYPTTPLLKAPFGVSDYQGDGKFKMQLSIEAADSDEEKVCSAWLEELRAVDEAMINWGMENWEQIPCFKKKPSRDVAEDKYSSIVKEPEEGSAYAPKLKCGFGMTRWYEGLKDENDEVIAEDDFVSEPNFEIYSATGEQINISDLSELPSVIPPGSLVRLCFSMKIWSLAATGFGLSLNALTLQVTPNHSANLKGVNPFAESSAPASVPYEDPDAPEEDDDEEVPDSDEDEEDDEEEDEDEESE